ncbi:MAG UNVERIFIED_CONTAM: hypothetical protein LVR18_33320 [Planctomycetaceae bacterium]
MSPGDEVGLASVVRRLLLNRAAAGDNSRSPVAFPFEKTLMLEQTLGLYEELVSIRRNAPGTR